MACFRQVFWFQRLGSRRNPADLGSRAPQTGRRMPGLGGGREEGPARGSCRKCRRQNKPHCGVRVDPVAYLNSASGGEGEPIRMERACGAKMHSPSLRGRSEGASSARRGEARAAGRRAGAGPGPGGGRGGGERGGPSPGAVNFSGAAACQPQKALKVQQPAPASAAAFVRVIYDFNLGSPRVHTAFAAVEG